jgi:hypothetical protein
VDFTVLPAPARYIVLAPYPNPADSIPLATSENWLAASLILLTLLLLLYGRQRSHADDYGGLNVLVDRGQELFFGISSCPRAVKIILQAVSATYRHTERGGGGELTANKTSLAQTRLSAGHRVKSDSISVTRLGITDRGAIPANPHRIPCIIRLP